MDKDYKETIKERIKILPEQLRAFVLDENWRREAEKMGKQFSFNEEKYASFENEIFLVLLCFEPRKDFAENIKNELGIDSNMAGWIAEDVGKNILSKVAGEIDMMWQAEGPEQSEGGERGNGVAEDFEQIILNQAKAMQPAVPPENLPTGSSEPKKANDYPPDNDPYREPLA